MATIVLGVSASIAAYKAADICSKLRQRGHEIHVVMTEAATRLVSPNTFLYLTGNKVHFDLWSEDQSGVIEHIALTDRAELIVLAPATANLIGQLANGLASDLLTTMMLAAACPVLVCPAMNPRMLAHPAVQSNLARLESFGYEIATPAAGRMACGHSGPGRLVEPAELVNIIEARLRGEARPCLRFLESWEDSVAIKPSLSAALIEAERDYREALRRRGQLESYGWLYDDPRRGGFAVLLVSAEDEAHRLMGQAPLAEAGLLAPRLRLLRGVTVDPTAPSWDSDAPGVEGAPRGDATSIGSASPARPDDPLDS